MAKAYNVALWDDKNCSKIDCGGGSFLVVQWLGFGAFTTVAQDSIPGLGTEIPHQATAHHSPKKDKK